MYRICKEIHFSYGHRLLKHKGKCAHLHGHNAIAEIRCSAKRLDKNQMVIDFERIGDALKGWILTHLDHRMILNEKDPLGPILKKWKEPFYPLKDDPTAESIAKLIYEEAFKRKLPVEEVILWETPSSWASYSR